MANYAVWNNRKRHEWLSKPLKGKNLSLRQRNRCGLQEAIERKADEAEGEAEAEAAAEA